MTTDEGNKTFLENQKINWNKFQLMGDVLMVIVESQRNPYRDLRGNAVVEKMILEAVISTNEDVSYTECLLVPNWSIQGLSLTAVKLLWLL